MIYFDSEFLDIRAYLIAYIIISFFGLCIGSFLNVCIYRLPKNESLIKKSSHCMTCGAKIRFYDLVPVFSWLFLRGKCRNCGEKISGRYPLVESINWIAYLMVLTFVDVLNYPVHAVITALFFSVLIVIAFIDYDTRTIRTGQLLLIFLLSIASALLADTISIKERIIGALCISVPFFIIGELTRSYAFKKTGEKSRGLELGDTLLMLVSGALIGAKCAVVSTLFGLIVGSVCGIISKKKGNGSVLPLGPFLAIGLLFGTLFGTQIGDWYLSLLAAPVN